MTEHEPDREELEAIGEWLAAGRPLPRPRFQIELRRHLRGQIATQQTRGFDALGGELGADMTPRHPQTAVQPAHVSLPAPAGGLERPGLAVAACATGGLALLAVVVAGLFGAGPFAA